MFIAETRIFGFQNVFDQAESLCPALLGTSANRSTSLQICKLRTQGLGLQICELLSYRKDLRICGKKLKSTAKQQHHWDRFCNF